MVLNLSSTLSSSATFAIYSSFSSSVIPCGAKCEQRPANRITGLRWPHVSKDFNDSAVRVGPSSAYFIS